jgi:hypothetical protein
MLSRFFQTVGRYSEAVLFTSVALAVLAAAVFLVSQDLLHAPARSHASAVAAASASPAQPTADVAPAAPPPAAPAAPGGGASVAKVEAAAQAKPDTRTDVTLFQRTDFNVDGKTFHIVVGLVYPDSKASAPRRQFCYLDAGNISAAASVTVSLAEKDERGNIERANIQDADAKTVGVALPRLQEAQTKCAFM